MTGRVAVAIVGVQPVLWRALGVPFEAASMTAGLAACLAVRIWISLTDVPKRAWGWGVDLSVTAIALLFTAAWIALEHPAPFYAMLSGTGFGALGTGIITIAVAWVKRIEPLVPRGDGDPASVSAVATESRPSEVSNPRPDSPTAILAEVGGDK